MSRSRSDALQPPVIRCSNGIPVDALPLLFGGVELVSAQCRPGCCRALKDGFRHRRRRWPVRQASPRTQTPF